MSVSPPSVVSRMRDRFSRFGARGLSVGNDVEYLQDGAEAYPQMLAAITQAVRSVHFETYIFDPDPVGYRFVRALAAKARTGVPVRLVVDAVGSYRLTADDLDYLRAAGVRVHVFNPIRLAPFEMLSRRNHRKLLVVDNCVAFAGGMNVSADHVEPPLGRAWRDAMVRVDGPAAQQLAESYATIFWRRSEIEALDHDAPAALPHGSGGRIRVLWNTWFGRRYLIRDAYLRHIAKAQRSITFAHSYFVPDRKVRSALRKAVQRGVRVRLMFPGLSDVPIVKRAMEAFYAFYFSLGVEVREWPGSMMHMKVALFDERLFTIGSYNLDHRSLKKNLEIALWISEVPPVLARVQETLEHDWARCVPVDPRTWHRRTWVQRVREWIAFRLRKRF